MSGTDLVFRVLAMNEASKVFKEVAASARETAVAVDESNAAAGVSLEKTAAREEEAGAGMGKGLMGVSPVLLGVAAAAAVIGAKSVEMGQEFEKGITTLATGAGESQANLKKVADGELAMATQTGTTTEALTKGMFMIESAGFHGAEGLTVLKAAAEGAKVGNADLSTEANAVTDVLNDYHLKASSATQVTDMLVKTVGSGKTSMEELAGSLSAVVPLASSAHIGFDQVAGALATMTAHGMSAQQSSQDLASTIGSLQSPNAVAVHEMQQLGLSSNKVSQDLGHKGLSGVLTELTGAITSHMGPAGLVVQSAFNNSAEAAKNAKTEIANLPVSLRSAAQGLLNGTTSAKEWAAATKGLDPISKNLAHQFLLTAKQTHSFNDLLHGGGPAAQTYNAALEKMTGGSTGLATALLLTGENADQFAGNVKAVGEAGKSTGKDVTGWSQVTSTLSFKMDQAKEVIETTGIKIGLILMPAVKLLVGGFTDVARVVGSSIGWLEQHKTVAESLGIGIAAVLVPSVWALVTALGAAAVEAAIAAAPFIAVIAIIAGIAFGIMELVKHWKDVEHVFVEGFDFVKDHWKMFVAALLPGVGLIIVGITEIVTHWKDIQRFLGDIWHETVKFFDEFFVSPLQQSWHTLVSWWDTGTQFFKNLFTRDLPSWWREGIHLFESFFVSPIESAIHRVQGAFSAVFSAIHGFVSAAFEGLIGIVKTPINGVIWLINSAISALDSISVSIPSWVPVVGGQTFGVNIPHIPTLAAGGMVMPRPGGSTVTVAEAGEPEIVTPLPAMQRALTAALTASGAHPGTAPLGTAENPLYAEVAFKLDGQVIDKQLVKFQTRGGRLQSVAMAVG
ncbi:phage tail tape measure protein [Streptacidiphilus rugosus]|uniref:phage tail tape measure protein n=1 Tax=Streptacidiphilus rugosus TaxID=405783 RepID=UPI00068C94B2|nr:phage tail tape measure protein [Streptacidiphilus rugosus]